MVHLMSLKNRLIFHVPEAFRSDPRDIIVNAKGLDADGTAWKGAAVFTYLESAGDCFISPEEWEKFGQKVLRERAPFPWT